MEFLVKCSEQERRRLLDDMIVIDHDMDSDGVTESDLSLKSRSFLNRVNDRLRKMPDCSSQDGMQDNDKPSMTEGTFMSSTLQAISFHGEELLKQFAFTMKQMSDISEKLIVGQSDEIFGVSSNQLGKVSMENFLW